MNIILFDLDKTIADIGLTEKCVLETIVAQYDFNIKEITYESVKKIVSATGNFISAYTDAFNYLLLNNTLPQPIKILEPAMLKRENIYYGLVTASPRVEARWVLERLDVRHYFLDNLIYTREDFTNTKADGECFYKARNLFPKARIVVIGDSHGDRVGAASAGLPCFSFPTSKNINEQKTFLRSAIEQAYEFLGV